MLERFFLSFAFFFLLCVAEKSYREVRKQFAISHFNPLQRDATSLGVTCCVHLHALLRIVGCCYAKFEIRQTLEPTTPNISFVPRSRKRSATMLDPFAQLVQHCWGIAHANFTYEIAMHKHVENKMVSEFL